MAAADFESWLLKQKKREDPVGDLARDREYDKRLSKMMPQSGEDWRWKTPDNALMRLILSGACVEARASLRVAATEWAVATGQGEWKFEDERDLAEETSDA